MRTDPRVESPALADISDLKSPALFLLPLRGALLLQRLGWLFLRFLLSVHTLAHGSPPDDGERADLKPTGQPWRLMPETAMPSRICAGSDLERAGASASTGTPAA